MPIFAREVIISDSFQSTSFSSLVNQFTGTIPSEVGLLTELGSLDLDGESGGDVVCFVVILFEA